MPRILKNLRQEDGEFEASVVYIRSLFLKKINNKEKPNKNGRRWQVQVGESLTDSELQGNFSLESILEYKNDFLI